MSRIRKATAAASATILLATGGLSAAQAATSSSSSASRPAPPGHRHGGPIPAAQLAALAKTLGVTTAQLKAALQASKPAKPAAARTSRATEIATALGADIAKVEQILAANRPAKPARDANGKPPAKHAKPDNTKLVAALASGLSIDEATVTSALNALDAAHKADHATREAAMYAAVAKQLGLSADAVKAAFEANRPAKPAAARAAAS